ncbi:MAG: TIGR01906 family membrane protein [Clostridia bacterium]|nr:TIGR01906 family membrane protein [Clostridia bacterium]
MKNKLLSVLFGLALAVLVLTAAIGLPIYVRPFYYAHINALDMPESTGHTYEEIRDAYDEVLDFLTLPGREFGSGVFPYSEEGKSHFADCKGLFTLNLVALCLSAAVVITLFVLKRKRLFTPARPCGHPISLWVGFSLLGLFGLLVMIVAADFSAAFHVFHAIFFPGKDNWLFDPREDAIINVMPNQFFMNCGILIAGAIILTSIAMIVVPLVLQHRQSKKDAANPPAK